MRRSKPAVFRSAILLVILCFAVYGNILNGAFVWDDQMQVVRNANIRTLDNIPRAFVSSLWSFVHAPGEVDRGQGIDHYYRPIQTVIYILTYQVGGLSPFAYHVTNVLLHSAATVALFILCIQLGLPSLVSFLAATLFAVHPVHTEAVSWIAGVGDVACAVFYFSGLYLFLRYRSSRKLTLLIASSLCFLAALLSKEMAVTFPAVALLLVLVPQGKHRPDLKTALAAISPFFLVLAAYAGLRLIAVGSQFKSLTQMDVSILDWATLLIVMVGQYLRYVIAPWPLYVYHLVPVHLHDRFLLTALFGAAILAITIVAWSFRHKFRAEMLCLLAFVVSLAPVLYFPAITGGAFFAERYLYIPSMMIVLLAALLLARTNNRYAIAVTCGVACVFSVLTIIRNSDWNNEERLFGRTLEIQPESAMLSTSLAEIYLRRGEDQRAQEQFGKSLQYLNDTRFLQDQYELYRVYLGLGISKARQSKADAALADLKKALDIYPQGDDAYATWGGILVTQRDYTGAIAILDKAIHLSAVNELARDYMGVALVNQGRYEEAVKYFREALAINPDLESARQHLQVALGAVRR